MAQKSYEHAVQTLKDRLGARWEGVEIDGRSEIVRTLEHELGIAHAEANDLVDALITSGDLSYHRDTPHDAGVADMIPAIPAAGLGGAPISSAGGTGGIPAVPAMIRTGYWQIGSAASERGAERLTREGQVDPPKATRKAFEHEA